MHLLLWQLYFISSILINNFLFEYFWLISLLLYLLFPTILLPKRSIKFHWGLSHSKLLIQLFECGSQWVVIKLLLQITVLAKVAQVLKCPTQLGANGYWSNVATLNVIYGLCSYTRSVDGSHSTVRSVSHYTFGTYINHVMYNHTNILHSPRWPVRSLVN